MASDSGSDPARCVDSARVFSRSVRLNFRSTLTDVSGDRSFLFPDRLSSFSSKLLLSELEMALADFSDTTVDFLGVSLLRFNFLTPVVESSTLATASGASSDLPGAFSSSNFRLKAVPLSAADLTLADFGFSGDVWLLVDF